MKSASTGHDYLWRDKAFARILQWAILSIIYFLLYGAVLSELIAEWYSDSIYSYGILVPVISCYLIRRKAAELSSVPIISSTWGYVLLLMAVALYCVGQLATDAFVMRVSMLLAVVALVQILFGSLYLKALSFPLLYLFFMIPLPTLLAGGLTDILKLFDVLLSAKVLQALGVPVFPESDLLHLPNVVLTVTAGCSGASSILALFALGLVYAYLLPVGPMSKVLLAASVIPLAVVANLFRIIVTVALTYHIGPVVLRSFFHEFTGTVNFLLSVFLLLMMGEGLLRRFGASQYRSGIDQSLSTRVRVTKSGWVATGTAAAILGIGIWIGGGIRNAATNSVPIGLERLPSIIGTYAVTRTQSPDVYSDPTAGEALGRVYSTSTGIPIELFVGYRGNDGRGGRLQSPRVSLPDNWNYIWVKSATIETAAGSQLQVNWMLTQHGNNKRVVMYWYESGGQVFTGELHYRFALLKARIVNAKRGMAVVRIATPLLSGEKIEEAQQRLKGFVSELYPPLGKIIQAS